MHFRMLGVEFLQSMVGNLCANLERHQFMEWCALPWLASRNQIGSRPSNGIFRDVREKGRQEKRDEEAQKGHMGFVYVRTSDSRPYDENYCGYNASVYE